jgi:hypothetical protein
VANQTATLRVIRESAPWRDKLRKYKIVVDGATVGAIANGATTDVSVEAGYHTLRLGISWAGSPTVEFAIADGECLTWACGPNGKSSSGLWQAIFTPSNYVTISRA